MLDCQKFLPIRVLGVEGNSKFIKNRTSSIGLADKLIISPDKLIYWQPNKTIKIKFKFF